MTSIIASAQEFWDAHARGELIGLRTSGTSTGAGRVVVRSTSSWVDSFAPLANLWGLGKERWWIPGPLTSTMNLFAAVLTEHLGGSWGLDADGATIVQLTPATLHRFLGRDRGTIRRVVVAGAALDPELRDRARAAGLDVLHYYGAAELSMVATGTAFDDLRLFDDVDVDVRDGVLWVWSPWLSFGYLEPDDAGPLRRDSAGFMSVGDRGRLVGERLTVEGRPGAVTTAGQTVQLAPLEHRLREQAKGDVVLVGAPDPLVGEVLTAIVSDADDLTRLRAWARQHLNGADRPRRWVHLGPFPIADSGKWDLKAISAAVRRGRG